MLALSSKKLNGQLRRSPSVKTRTSTGLSAVVLYNRLLYHCIMKTFHIIVCIARVKILKLVDQQTELS